MRGANPGSKQVGGELTLLLKVPRGLPMLADVTTAIHRREIVRRLFEPLLLVAGNAERRPDAFRTAEVMLRIFVNHVEVRSVGSVAR
jgi:hypothetical protein